jgi:alpha-tubulin suppressor-like RCC1 family protein
MNVQAILCGVLALAGCVQAAPVLQPSQVFESDVVRTQFRVSEIPYADYLEASDSELKIRDGVEVWIGPERAEIMDVDQGGMLLRLSATLPVGLHDLRVHAAVDHVRVGALRVVAGEVRDGGSDTVDGSLRDASPSDNEVSPCTPTCELANASSLCRSGACKIESCASGFEDCDERPSNGCEIDTASSAAHCGVCGRPCGAGEDCVLGNCGRVSGRVAAGRSHSCVVLDGQVHCWGQNSKGELGSASPATSLVPMLVPGLTDIVAVAAGTQFSCALHVAGTISCWGANTKGALGDAGGDRPEPRRVDGIVDASAISAGPDFVCVLLQGGGVRCWGHNQSGQLGAESDNISVSPVAVTTISTAVDVDCGDTHACAVLASGEVMCWGEGEAGGLGNGETNDSTVPVGVVRLTDVTSVSVGQHFACAARAAAAGGECWGEGSQGQLGNAATDDSPAPVRVAFDMGPAEVTAGLDFACSLLPSGDVHCWGRQTHGQLGVEVDGNLLAPPMLPVMSDVLAVAAGESHACALRNDGAVFCWGRNNHGQIGDGTMMGASRPVRVLGL